MSRFIGIDVGTKNFAYCVVQEGRIIKWDVQSIASDTHEGSCTKLVELLESLDLFTTNSPLNVIIELQLGRNPKTMTVMGRVEMYFTLQKMMGENIEKIVTYHAKNKLKYYKPHEGDTPLPVFTRRNYYNRKKLSIEHAKRVLAREDSAWLEFFMSHKKKDDLSDCYLMLKSYNR